MQKSESRKREGNMLKLGLLSFFASTGAICGRMAEIDACMCPNVRLLCLAGLSISLILFAGSYYKSLQPRRIPTRRPLLAPAV